MNNTRKLDESQVLETAMAIVKSAQATIHMTMLASEELERPLPSEYFSLLQKKVREGVFVTRIGFGSREEFKELAKHVGFVHKNYRFFITTSTPKNYRRMLLVDKTVLLFATHENGLRHVYYTTDKPLIAEALDYLTSNICDDTVAP